MRRTVDPSEVAIAVAPMPDALGGARSRLGWVVAWFAIVVAAAGLVLAVINVVNGGDLRRILSHQALTPIITVGYAVMGGLVASKRPGHAVGWIFLVTAVLYSFTALFAAYAWGNVAASEFHDLLTWFGLWLWLPAVMLPLIFVLLLFPDGRLPSRPWLLAAWSAGAGLALCSLTLMLHPGPLEMWGTDANPFGHAPLAPVLDVAVGVGTALLMIGLVASSVAPFVRFRRASGETRQQLKWLLYALLFIPVGFAVGVVAWLTPTVIGLGEELAITLTNLTVLAIVVGTGTAILKHRLYDIDIIINRTIVYAVLTAAVVGIYIVTVGALGALFRSRTSVVIALLATGVIAALAQPLRTRLQRAVNQLLYGQRDEPGQVLGALGERLEQATELEGIEPLLVEQVGRALKLPYVALGVLRAGSLEVAAEFGARRPTFTTFPIVYQGEELGELRVAARDAARNIDPADQRLLEVVTRQAGAALKSAQLSRDLRSSHRRIVELREDERRRLRRDLHDGIGPALAGMTLKVDAADNQIESDPAAASALLVELREQLQDTVGSLRQLVHDLRPPALDELGLVAAVRAQARQFEQGGLNVRVDVANVPAALPAAVEVAAYRIVQEALTNVVRHSGARNCVVSLVATHDLVVTVRDDGAGLPPTHRPGVGLSSMRERVLELGGHVTVSGAPGGGVELVARLPLEGP